MKQKKIHSKKKNVSIVGVNKYDRDKGINEVSHPYMGPLHGNGTISSLHDLYIHRLEQWKRNNPEVIKDTIDKFPNPDAHNHALQQLHFEDWADELESNEYHPINVKPKDDMTEKEITDMLYSGEDTSPLDEFPVKKGLGMGYWFGLEALDPVQRHKVMSHLHTKGSVDKGNQIINLGDGMKISTGRINRNIAHRFSPEFFHYGRPVHLHGANVKKHIESDNDHPEGEDFYLKHALHKALMETPHGSDDGNQTTMGAHLLSEINDNLFDMPQWDEELKTHFDSNNKPVNLLQHLPIKAIKQAKSIRQKALKHKSLDYQDAIKEELQLLDEKDPHTYLDKNTLLDLLGYEADGSPLGEDNHSIIPNFEQPFFNKEKIDELLINARDIADLSAKAKPMRNFDAYNYLGKNGPDWNDIPEDEKESWLTSKNGDAVGIGSHFSQIFHSRGGHGKNRLSFLEMIHDTLPKDEDGYSLIGKIDNGEFKPNRKNIGMFGRYIPSLYDKRFQTHSGPHGATSLWDASSHLSGRARNPKNMPFFDMTSLSGGYSNKVRYLTPSERGDMIDGQSNNHLLDRHGHFTTNPLLAVGGRDNKLTQTKSNSKMALNKITSLGATYPPHAPAPFVTLNRKEIKSGRFPLSHSEGNVNLYSLFHEYDGKTLDADWQSKVKLSSDNPI